jgi:acyl-ACP thioesterase
MSKSYRKEFQIRPTETDRYGRLKPSAMLLYIQQTAGEHSDSYDLTYDALAQRGIFWAVIRHRIEIIRLPVENETITLETWPMPTTRVAYPRSTVAYDAQGNVLFRSVCLWILMDLNDRSMLVPKKSGVEVDGFLRGDELPTPKSLLPQDLQNCVSRSVVFSDLDRNGHMNNARYLDWVQDLLPSEHHREHPVKELTMCYINEALENQQLDLMWDYDEEGILHVDIHRSKDGDGSDYDRIFATRIKYE